MSDIFKVVVRYTGAPGLPGTNTLFAQENDIAISEFRDNLDDFYGTVFSSLINTGVTVEIPSTGEILDTNTGGVIGIWNSGSPISHTGGQALDPLPFATQGLVQLRTGLIVGGREVRGRFFIPGFTEASSDAGVPGSTVVTSMTNVAQDCFEGHGAVFSPTKKRWATISNATFWNEWAILRSRRD